MRNLANVINNKMTTAQKRRSLSAAARPSQRFSRDEALEQRQRLDRIGRGHLVAGAEHGRKGKAPLVLLQMPCHLRTAAGLSMPALAALPGLWAAWLAQRRAVRT